MQIQRFSSFEQLQTLEVAWRELANGHPFSDWDWCHSWWSAYGDDRELYVLVATDDSHVVGIAPWCLEKSATRGRRVKFLGTGHACTDYVSILATPEQQDRVTNAFANWLLKANEATERANTWDFLSFEGVLRDSSSMNALRGAMEVIGHTTHDDAPLRCWRLNVGADWDGYLSSLGSKSKRRKVRDVRRKYIENGRSNFQVATSDSQFEEYFNDFVLLHQMRRESLGECGCFASSEFSTFLEALSRHYFAQGRLLLTRLKIDNELAASSLGIQDAGTHYMYQTGMAPSMSEHSPGWIMNVQNILHAQQQGLTSIDYLRGDEPYKERLGAVPIEMDKFRIVGRRASSVILDSAWLLRSEVKQTLPTFGSWFSSGSANSEQN